MNFDANTMNMFWTRMVELSATWLPKLLLAILALIIGLWVVRAILRGLHRFFEKQDYDPALEKFLESVLGVLLRAAVIIMVASMVGIQTTSFVALIGAAGLAVGLALQGSLSNFAGGVLILMFKPFKVGDYITGSGHSGTVHSIQIFQTILKTPDNKTIIIPNGSLSNGDIVNFSTEPTRRVDFDFGIGYDDDIAKTKEVLLRLANADERVHQEPAPFVAVKAHGDSAVTVTLRVWVDAGNYWPLFFDMMERVKVTFDSEGISIPYPQTDVHLHKVEG